jgi:hypothetical protein
LFPVQGPVLFLAPVNCPAVGVVGVAFLDLALKMMLGGGAERRPQAGRRNKEPHRAHGTD